MKTISLKETIMTIFWLLIGTLSFFLIDISLENHYKNSMILIGFLMIIHGFGLFYKLGDNLITPSSIFMLISAILGGFTSIYIVYWEGYNIQAGHYIGSYIMYISQVLITPFLWKNSDNFKKNPKKTIGKEVKPEVIRWGIKVGLLMIIGSCLVSQVSNNSSFLKNHGIYVGIIILSTSFFRGNKKKYSIKEAFVILTLFMYYYYFIFSGFGRINLATLLLAIILTFHHKITSKFIKKLILIGAIPSLAIASLLRGGSVEDLSGGIGSVISPNYRFGQIVQLYNEGFIKLKFGETIWAGLVIPIPRQLWINKPWGFNRKITYLFRPDLVKYGHSEAALIYGEWIYNFGYIGIIIGILFMGLILYYLDRTFLRINRSNDWSRLDLIKYVAIIITSSGLLDFYWGGFSTFMSRAGIRLIILYLFVIPLLLYSYIFTKKNHEKTNSLHQK